jgi:hypothetical protein
LSQAAAICFYLGRAEAAGLVELLDGARQWRVWHLLGVRELRQRYARSRLGQLWLVLSVSLMLAVMSAAWSVLYNQPVGELAPFIGVGFVVWTFLSQVLTDCTMVFVSHGNFYRNQKMSFSVSIFSVIYKNSIVLAHSLIIVLGLIVLFGVPVNWYDLQIVPALVLTWIAIGPYRGLDLVIHRYHAGEGPRGDRVGQHHLPLPVHGIDARGGETAFAGDRRLLRARQLSRSSHAHLLGWHEPAACICNLDLDRSRYPHHGRDDQCRRPAVHRESQAAAA